MSRGVSKVGEELVFGIDSVVERLSYFFLILQALAKFILGIFALDAYA